MLYWPALNHRLTIVQWTIWHFYNDSPSTAQYFGATIVLLAISTSLTVLVLNVHYRGSLNNPVPPLVQLVVLNWLARLLRLGKRVHDKHKGHLNIAKMVWSLVTWSTKIKQWTISPNHQNYLFGAFLVCDIITPFTFYIYLRHRFTLKQRNEHEFASLAISVELRANLVPVWWICYINAKNAEIYYAGF